MPLNFDYLKYFGWMLGCHVVFVLVVLAMNVEMTGLFGKIFADMSKYSLLLPLVGGWFTCRTLGRSEWCLVGLLLACAVGVLDMGRIVQMVAENVVVVAVDGGSSSSSSSSGTTGGGYAGMSNLGIVERAWYVAMLSGGVPAFSVGYAICAGAVNSKGNGGGPMGQRGAVYPPCICCWRWWSWCMCPM